MLYNNEMKDIICSTLQKVKNKLKIFILPRYNTNFVFFFTIIYDTLKKNTLALSLNFSLFIIASDFEQSVNEIQSYLAFHFNRRMQISPHSIISSVDIIGRDQKYKKT